METQLTHLKNPHKIVKNSKTMKTRYKIGLWAVVAVAGSAIVGGSIWWWIIALLVGKFVVRLIVTIALAVFIYFFVYALIIGGILWILIS